MPEQCASSVAESELSVSQIQHRLDKLCFLAQNDLSDAFSCLKAAADHPERQDLLRAYMDEYKRTVLLKLDLAVKIMLQSAHAGDKHLQL